MSSYSVAEAENGLPGLIDRALAGEEVLITRYGRVLVEIRPALPATGAPADKTASLAWLRERRRGRPRIGVDSAAVLRAMADENSW